MFYRILLLLAVLLMPFDMAAAPAAALEHPAAGRSMPMEHCPDQGTNHAMKGGFAECTMACSAALPATDFDHKAASPVRSEAVSTVVVAVLDGLHPDTATPPPKHS